MLFHERFRSRVFRRPGVQQYERQALAGVPKRGAVTAMQPKGRDTPPSPMQLVICICGGGSL
ncbi:hypothetical protein A5906_31040 [Bradyrhizobium sacchari]|nr:hypothetical protein A5906_31040 [Bradyrhizobium sacchari]